MQRRQKSDGKNIGQTIQYPGFEKDPEPGIWDTMLGYLRGGFPSAKEEPEARPSESAPVDPEKWGRFQKGFNK